jgi:RNA polymerase sigma-70 factor, ECF subfamily
MEQLDDEALVAAWRLSGASPSGQAHLNELFRRHHARVALWCFRATGDREWAADLAQEVFLKAFRNLDSFRGDSRFTTWLYTIARNHCWNELKSRSVRPEGSSDEMPVDLVSPQADAHTELERQMSGQQVREWMRDNLTETESRVMTLHYVEELPFDAIGRLLQLDNASGAKAYIVSAKRKLQKVAARWRAAQGAGRD